MPTVAPAPSKRTHPARRRALEPYLQKLESWCANAGGVEDLERRANIKVGQRNLPLEPWERLQLKLYFDDHEGQPGGTPELTAHGSAQLIKIAFDVVRLKQGNNLSSAALYALQAELMLDTALGMALLKEAQAMIDELVRAGKVEPAKNLSQFRHKLVHAVTEAKQHIAESERAQAEELCGALTDIPDFPEPETTQPQPTPQAPRTTAPTAPDVEAVVQQALAEQVEGPLAAPRRRTRPSGKPTARRSATPRGAPVTLPSRTQLLAVGLAIAFALWLILVQAPKLLIEELPVLARGDFRDAELMTELHARPPSVYITLDEERWWRLRPAERNRVVREFADTTFAAGFQGMHVRGESGRPLARWLKDRGVESINQGEEALASATLSSESALQPTQ